MSYDFDETHKKILESALKSFMQKGFREASIRTICNKAGVTNGAFYAHFKSKEDLFASLVQPALDQLIFLYTKETIHFGKINSSNDILKAFSKTFSAQEVIIHFIYKNKDLFHLLLKSSGGTKYENFPHSLIMLEQKESKKFFYSCKEFLKKTDNFSENIIKGTSKNSPAAIFSNVPASSKSL